MTDDELRRLAEAVLDGSAPKRITWSDDLVRELARSALDGLRYKAAVVALLGDWATSPDVQVRDAAHDIHADLTHRLGGEPAARDADVDMSRKPSGDL